MKVAATATATGPFLVFTEGEYSRTLNTEQECREFVSRADDATAGNVRVSWVPVSVAEAAPELMAALREYVERQEAENDDCNGLPEYDQACAAIAKALGQ